MEQTMIVAVAGHAPREEAIVVTTLLDAIVRLELYPSIRIEREV